MRDCNWRIENNDKLSAGENKLLKRSYETIMNNVVVDDDSPWKPFRCITLGKGFYGIWNWDTEFHSMAVSRWDTELAEEGILGFMQFQKDDGMLPDVIRIDGSIDDRLTKRPLCLGRQSWYIGEAEIKNFEKALSDFWDIPKREEEFEMWWFDLPMFTDVLNGDTVKITAPTQIVRGCKPVLAENDKNGNKPYVVASQNPNGVISVATIGRTHARTYEIPHCRVTLCAEDADTIGVFGEFEDLIIETNKNVTSVFIQDIAADEAFDITEEVVIGSGKITVPGEIFTENTIVYLDNIPVVYYFTESPHRIFCSYFT